MLPGFMNSAYYIKSIRIESTIKLEMIIHAARLQEPVSHGDLASHYVLTSRLIVKNKIHALVFAGFMNPEGKDPGRGLCQRSLSAI
jgi:hypothetical protein